MNYVSNSKVRGEKQTVLEAGQASYLLQNNEINGYPFEMSKRQTLLKVLLLEPVRLFCLETSLN
jgi:hypothetical protein